MVKTIFSILFMTALLFGYQKGDVVSKDIATKLNLQKNKVYVIDFFASWCESCKKEMPHLSSIYNKIDKKRVGFIGVDVDEDINQGKNFQKELRDANKLTFKVIDDPKNEIIKEFNPIGMPALFFIKENRVVEMILGARDNIDEEVDEILKGLL